MSDENRLHASPRAALEAWSSLPLAFLWHGKHLQDVDGVSVSSMEGTRNDQSLFVVEEGKGWDSL